MKYSNGPNMKPWGTLLVARRVLESIALLEVYCHLSVKYISKHQSNGISREVKHSK